MVYTAIDRVIAAFLRSEGSDSIHIQVLRTHLERVVQSTPDVVPQRPYLFRELEDPHADVYFLRFPDGEAISINKSTVRPLQRS